MKNYCPNHPCLKTTIEGLCPEQIFLSQIRAQKLCSKNRADCPFYHPLAFGYFDSKDRILVNQKKPVLISN